MRYQLLQADVENLNYNKNPVISLLFMNSAFQN